MIGDKVDIPDKHIKELSEICKNERVSRAEVIREAIACYLEMKKTMETMLSVFGGIVKIPHFARNDSNGSRPAETC